MSLLYVKDSCEMLFTFQIWNHILLGKKIKTLFRYIIWKYIYFLPIFFSIGFWEFHLWFSSTASCAMVLFYLHPPWLFVFHLPMDIFHEQLNALGGFWFIHINSDKNVEFLIFSQHQFAVVLTFFLLQKR